MLRWWQNLYFVFDSYIKAISYNFSSYSGLGNKMTDSLAFHRSGYSKEAFLRSHILSIDTINSLKQQCLNYPKKRKPVIDHLNVYFLRNKLADFKKLILNETDMPLFSESRLGNNFPNDQHQAKG